MAGGKTERAGGGGGESDEEQSREGETACLNGECETKQVVQEDLVCRE